VKTMKFYRQRKDGKVEVLSVRVNQALKTQTGNTRNPHMAGAIAARGEFVKKSVFGEARLARARAEGRVLAPQIVGGRG
jgi:hypothetical protein